MKIILSIVLAVILGISISSIQRTYKSQQENPTISYFTDYAVETSVGLLMIFILLVLWL